MCRITPRSPDRRGFVVRAHLAVCHCHMRRVGGVALERLGALKGGIQHQVGVGGGESINIDVDIHKPRNFAGKAFQTLLDASLDGGFSSADSSSFSCQRITCLTITKTSCVFLIVTGRERIRKRKQESLMWARTAAPPKAQHRAPKLRCPPTGSAGCTPP